MPREPVTRTTVPNFAPYSHPTKLSPPNTTESAEDVALVTPQQVRRRSQALSDLRQPQNTPVLSGCPVSGEPYPVDDFDFDMIYLSTETDQYPEAFSPRHPSYLAKYEILCAMYPLAFSLRKCKKTNKNHSISISSSGTLSIKCCDCDIAKLCSPVPANHKKEFNAHFMRWKKRWESDRGRRESLKQLFEEVDRELI
ncbi:hypothetical protein K435DRAFT_860599 [Dendrothele bispora CBS 962.96]|uniref:Uncharacterized protein n=1 Tax=Dendrothele bispora (strain CBS 962.96) TaxID=1314807 RepID=A0A4S8LXJ5_DENBC|nr:hypothetical protein K435DRAFT_860599 [Dendrothele bispora CBS 962.96]